MQTNKIMKFSFIPLSNRLYPLEPDELSVILGEYFARKTPMNTDELFLRPFRPNAGENYSTANDVNNPKAQQEVYVRQSALGLVTKPRMYG